MKSKVNIVIENISLFKHFYFIFKYQYIIDMYTYCFKKLNGAF